MKMSDLILAGALAVGAYFLFVKKDEIGNSGGGGGSFSEGTGYRISEKSIPKPASGPVVYHDSAPTNDNIEVPYKDNQVQSAFAASYADKYGIPITNITPTKDPQIMTVQPSSGQSYQVWRPASSAAEAKASEAANMEQVNRILASGNYLTNAVVNGVSTTVMGTKQKV